MKRAEDRAWPKEMVDVPPETPDPRSRDSYATQKISRAELEEALKRTKSGTRRAVRSDPSFEQAFEDKIEKTNESNLAPAVEVEPLVGPHDDTPQVTIVQIDGGQIDGGQIDGGQIESGQIESGQIESVELDALDRVTVASKQVPPPAMPVVTTPHPVEPVLRPMTPAYDFSDDAPRTSTERAITHRTQARRWQISPRTAFILGLALVLFVTLAAGAGFLAGRGMLRLPH
ncbi:hypothetical protein AKJ09_05990 [Labilithrix luteola]|uniref:Uncharacterized protein n=1 Tax=Labilithrix luteola TaxID=1391654 RepID=A0A0K1Q125_9BACT|nr:hypothetical protein [Labilithrix luteola]AKU99326.1 hypothetical protein AKJ09_05990 [Labilithrix luteola]